MKKIIFLILMGIFFSNCEKDDICSDETTPRLVIEFFDISNPSNTKNIASLQVKEVSQSNVYNTFSGVSKIQLPLKINGTSVQYSFVLNSNDPANINEDLVQFNYTTSTVYVSRACGYKTIFNLNPGIPQTTDSSTNDGLWIQNIIVENSSINTVNETHLKIYF